jgi:hypothetical protein
MHAFDVLARECVDIEMDLGSRPLTDQSGLHPVLREQTLAKCRTHGPCRRYESSLRFDPPRLSQTSMPSALEWLSSLLATLCLLGACRQLCIPRSPGDRAAWRQLGTAALSGGRECQSSKLNVSRKSVVGSRV